MAENENDEHNAVRRPVFIRHLGNASFKTHFRMSTIVFERLVQVIGPHQRATGLLQRECIDVSESILMGLWVLFNPDTFRSEGLNFGVSTSVLHRHYKRLILSLCQVGHLFIKWPSAEERRRSALHWRRTFGFIGAVSAIDGTLIEITAPSEQKQRYVDRHHKYSMNVQIVSDHRRVIRDIYVGQPGSVNDNRVFKCSPLGRNLYGRDNMLADDEHLIGDSAYTNTSKLLSPYRDYGNLTPSHRHFNYLLSQCRATVERLNALLKARMARLRRLFTKDIETTVLHITASAVIYNFVLLDGQESDGMLMEGEPPNIYVEAAINALEQAGAEKRRNIRILLEEGDGDDEEEFDDIEDEE